MNILIITPFYKQDRNIASVRWTNIAQRLAKRHNIIVVTQPLDNDMDMTFSKKEEDGILVARMNQKTGYEKLAIKYFHGATGDDWQTAGADDSINQIQRESFVRKAKNMALYTSMQLKAKSYAKQIVKNVIPKGMKIDVVISSACPFIEMLFGYEMKKLLGCKWISDFRDLPFITEGNDDVRRMKRIMIRSLKTADAVITIAPKGKVFLIEHGIVGKEKIHVITNGFSQTDAVKIEPYQDDVLHLVHTGSLYGGRRRPDLLLRAMQEIKIEHPACKIQLELAGGNNAPLLEKAIKYGIVDQIVDHGFLPRTEAIALQNKADCLVAFVEDRPGTLAAKLFEYTLLNKPIIVTMCGEGKDSDESRFVKRCKLGIAVEERNGETDYEALKEYVYQLAFRKLRHLKMPFSPDYTEIQKYNIDEIARHIESLCSNLVR